jgi:hypothetical protein
LMSSSSLASSARVGCDGSLNPERSAIILARVSGELTLLACVSGLRVVVLMDISVITFAALADFTANHFLASFFVASPL